MARGAVSLYGKHPFQCGRRNAQPPGNRNIVFYILVHNAATDDQGMGAPQHYHAAVRHTELGPEGVYRYYSTQRPVDIGTYPKPPDNQPLSIVNYDDDRRRPVADGRLMAWGELTYAKPLTEKQMEDYELKPAPGNPDRVRPSITARLKEGTRGQEPPKEPGQKRSHKNHEER